MAVVSFSEVPEVARVAKAAMEAKVTKVVAKVVVLGLLAEPVLLLATEYCRAAQATRLN